MIGQFRKELVSTDWINSRFHPENCFWALNHIYHARNSLALWFVMVLFVALNIFFVHSMYILLFIRKFCHWRQRMHKEVFFFYSAELTINVHVNGRHILVFCKKKIIWTTGKRVNNNNWNHWKNIFSLNLWVPSSLT